MEENYIFYSDGSVYDGDIVNGQPNGDGIISLYIENRLNDVGREYVHHELFHMEWIDGISDEMDIKNKPRANGYCSIEYNQTKYTGHFTNGKLNGFIAIHPAVPADTFMSRYQNKTESIFKHNICYERRRVINYNIIVYKEITNEYKTTFGEDIIEMNILRTKTSYTKHKRDETVKYNNTDKIELSCYESIFTRHIKIYKNRLLRYIRETHPHGDIVFKGILGSRYTINSQYSVDGNRY